MIKKDWAFDAAKEIAAEFTIARKYTALDGESNQHYLKEELSRIIAKHCPFKSNSYMPVPKCETCKLWRHRGNDTGLCGLREKSNAKLWPEAYDGIVTTPDFGCVQWEKK